MSDWIDQLKELGGLLKDGLITEEEFEFAKKKLLPSSSFHSDDYSPFSFEQLFPELKYRLNYNEQELLAMTPEDMENLLDMWILPSVKQSYSVVAIKGRQKIITHILQEQAEFRRTGNENLLDDSFREKK